MGDAFASERVSRVGSEATVNSELDVRDDLRCLVLCECDRGELCDECPLKGQYRLVFSSRYLLLCSCVRGSVKSGWHGVFERLRDENRSGGLGKSSQEPSGSTTEDEEGRGKFGSWCKCGCGSSVVQGGRKVTVWSCAAEAAGTQEEAAATYVGAGPPLRERAEMSARDAEEGVLAGSFAAMKGEVWAGREGAGGS